MNSIKIAWHESYNHTLPDNHKFPMKKYDLIYKSLISENKLQKKNLIYPNIIDDTELENTHDYNYINKINLLSLSKSEERRMGFPQSHSLVVREKIIANGTLLAALEANQNGISFNIAGGTHHAFSNKGEGFCIFNDQAIASNYLISEKLANKILIIDLDVHQGNGTAEIFKNKPDVFTFSIHGTNNYPLNKEISDLDIELNDNTIDKDYIDILEENIYKIRDQFKPNFIFYQAGVDVLKSDKFGRLNLSFEGTKRRDEIVFQLAKDYHIPIVCTMGGGYSNNIDDILIAHLNTFKCAF